MAFVTVTRERFEALLPEGFRALQLSGVKELVYQFESDTPGIGVRVYSTIEAHTGISREKGADAIRIVFWDGYNDRPIGKGKKILRVEGATTIEERIASRVQEFLKDAHRQMVVDFRYVKAILNSNEVNWSGFAKSLLESLAKYGKLTDSQLAYVIGDVNPKGKPTFEATVKQKDPDFMDKYLSTLEEENNGEQEEEGISGVENGTEEACPFEAGSQGDTGSEGDMDVHVERRLAGSQIPDRGGEVELIPTATYPVWVYPFESFNPVQSLVHPHKDEDCNMVIGANTSAGKTICAELLMDSVLAAGKRIVYMSPLKSLTQEKYGDWKMRFPEEEITILTGDYVLSNEMKENLGKSRIIVMTSEMVDSRTRRMESEKNYWLKEVGLLIVDESHILSTERGHAVETGIMRFTRINPSARVLFLSATMPNVGDLGEWLSTLNGKPATVIYNTWRPVQLQMHYCEYPVQINRAGYTDYWAGVKAKISSAIKIVMSKPDEKFLVFCHDKNTGRSVVKELANVGQESFFHNADLDLNERLEVESKFQDRNNGIRVLVSTSTLAWGRNLPARNVVIVGVHRGINEVDQLDIIQMAGRAGRYGIDDEGHVYLVIPQGSTGSWIETFRNPRPVISVLNNHQILAFHVLAEIAVREINSDADLLRWYQRSLAYRQQVRPFEAPDAKALMEDLAKMEMIGYSGIKPFITGLGKTSAWLYYSPYDVYAWFKNFSQLAADQWDDDLCLAWAVGNVPSNDLGYVPREIAKEAEEVKWTLRNRGLGCSDAVGTVMAGHDALRGAETEAGVLKAMRRSLVYDIDRICNAFELIDGMHAKWGKDNLWTVLGSRIKYGIGRELVELVKIPGVGAARARKLYSKGFRSVKDVANGDKKKLAMVFTMKQVVKIQSEARRLAA